MNENQDLYWCLENLDRASHNVRCIDDDFRKEIFADIYQITLKIYERLGIYEKRQKHIRKLLNNLKED